MKNNKGFSLVELIIVIAIMAILVGVMAPQLIKYIEKTNVSADVQLCDTVRQAIQTAWMDPTVVTKDDAATFLPSTDTALELNKLTQAANKDFYDSVKTTLGVEPKDMDAKIKSEARKNKGVITYQINSESGAVVVWITNSDMSGKKKSYSTVKTGSGENSSIWAGEFAAFTVSK